MEDYRNGSNMNRIKEHICEYCHGDIRQSLEDQNFYDLEVWVDDDSTLLVVDHHNENTTHININYCPMCGRKLAGISNV